jgi:hypothetical protein
MTIDPRPRSLIAAAFFSLLPAVLQTGCKDSQSDASQNESFLVPPPPVEQNIGITDRVFTTFVVDDCLKCHDGNSGNTCTDPAQSCTVISARHHAMLDPANPKHKPDLGCMSCHSVKPDTGTAVVVLNCVQCHTKSPHHTSAAAQQRHCAACHGSVVQNYDDGHYIPTYAKSTVTPATNCRIWSDADHSACKAGGCAACHTASTDVTPAIDSNANLHHGTGLGQAPNSDAQCGWCHSPSAELDIRTCETCHGPASLHGIEHQYDVNNGKPGHGHIGSDQDCWGCHGSFAKYDVPPLAGPTVPTARLVQPPAVRAGMNAEIAISGQSFANSFTSADGTTRTFDPVVVLSLVDAAGTEVAKEVLSPSSSTADEVRAVLPTTLREGVWEVRVAKDYQGALQKQSNRLPLVIQPRVLVESAFLSCADGRSTLTVAGQGFGPKPAAGTPMVGAWAGSEACAVASWIDREIVATCGSALAGDLASVIGIHNTDVPSSGFITGEGCGSEMPPAPAEARPTGSIQVQGGGAAAACGPSPSCGAFTAQVRKAVTFDASASSAVAPAAVSSYRWTVRSGSTVIKTSLSPSFSDTFRAAGSFTVTLVVTDSAGNASAASSATITVK